MSLAKMVLGAWRSKFGRSMTNKLPNVKEVSPKGLAVANLVDKVFLSIEKNRQNLLRTIRTNTPKRWGVLCHDADDHGHYLMIRRGSFGQLDVVCYSGYPGSERIMSRHDLEPWLDFFAEASVYEVRDVERRMIAVIHGMVATELIASEAPEGKGIELEASLPPEGRGTELIHCNRGRG